LRSNGHRQCFHTAWTDSGRTYTFRIRDGVKFHDGTPLTSTDVAASWQEIIDPPEGKISARQAFYAMIDKVEAPDSRTVVFRLKYATSAFLPALADPFAYIYEKAILDREPHWYEKNIMGSGPFKFVSYEAGQSIRGERNPDYYHSGLPYLDGFVGIFAPKLATRVDAIRADNAAIEFRSEPPSARDQLVKELGDEIAVQESDWNCGNLLTINQGAKPFDDVRVRRACFWRSTNGKARQPCPRSPSCGQSVGSCSRDRRLPPRRMSYSSLPASGLTSTSHGPKPSDC
jgi:peptide/nickel transport system substrate-binding protein